MDAGRYTAWVGKRSGVARTIFTSLSRLTSKRWIIPAQRASVINSTCTSTSSIIRMECASRCMSVFVPLLIGDASNEPSDNHSGWSRLVLATYLTYEERLKECGLTTLETRRLRGDQIEVFKILNGYENIDSNIFFEIKESKITRGHNYTLVKKQSRLDVRKFSFSQRTINVWNNLSTDCVHASSVNMFKNTIDKYRVKAGYT